MKLRQEAEASAQLPEPSHLDLSGTIGTLGENTPKSMSRRKKQTSSRSIFATPRNNKLSNSKGFLGFGSFLNSRMLASPITIEDSSLNETPVRPISSMKLISETKMRDFLSLDEQILRLNPTCQKKYIYEGISQLEFEEGLAIGSIITPRAIMHGEHIEYTYVALDDDTTLISMSKEAFSGCFKSQINLAKDKLAFINSVFNAPGKNIVMRISNFMKDMYFSSNDIVYQQGSKSNGMYFIQRGEICLYTEHLMPDDPDIPKPDYNGKYIPPKKGKTLVCKLTSGEFFGEDLILINKKKRAHTAQSLTHDTRLYYLPAMSFEIIKVWCPTICLAFQTLSEKRINWEADRTNFVDEIKKKTDNFKHVTRPQSVFQQVIDGPSIVDEEPARSPSPQIVRTEPDEKERKPSRKLRLFRKEPAGGDHYAYRIVYDHDPNRIIDPPKINMDLKTIMGMRIFVNSRQHKRPSPLRKSFSPLRITARPDSVRQNNKLHILRKFDKIPVEKKEYDEVEHIHNFTKELVHRLKNPSHGSESAVLIDVNEQLEQRLKRKISINKAKSLTDFSKIIEANSTKTISTQSQTTLRITSRASRPKTSNGLNGTEEGSSPSYNFPVATDRVRTPMIPVFQSVRWGDEFVMKKKVMNLRLDTHPSDGSYEGSIQASTTRSVPDTLVLPNSGLIKKMRMKKVAGFALNKLRK